MIQHLVAFRFRDGVPAEVRGSVLVELSELPHQFEAMRNFRIGANESNRDSRFEYAFTVEFDSFDDLDAYLTSERHERFVVERFRPHVLERAIVSFDPSRAVPPQA